jgi:hypothetical protein
MAFRRGLVRLGVVLTAVGVAAVPSAAGAVVAAVPRHTVGFNDTVRAIAYGAGTVYLGGDFTAGWLDGSTTRRGYLAAVDVATGRLTGWAPTVNGPVTAIAVTGNEVYVGGAFTTVDGQSHRHLAALDTAGALVAGFRDSVSSPPDALVTGFGRLYAAGDFATADNQPAGPVAAFGLAGGLDGGFKPVLDGSVHALAVGANRIYLGGMFGQVDGSAAHPRLAAVAPASGALDGGFAGGSAVNVRSLAVGPQGVYAGVSGAGGRLVGYNLAGRLSWNVQADGDLQSVAVLGSAVYGGGHFDHACSTLRTGVNGVCLDGSTPRGKLLAADLTGHLLPWSPAANSTRGAGVLAADPARNTLAAGGAFTTFNTTTTQQRFALFPG